MQPESTKMHSLFRVLVLITQCCQDIHDPQRMCATDVSCMISNRSTFVLILSSIPIIHPLYTYSLIFIYESICGFNTQFHFQTISPSGLLAHNEIFFRDSTLHFVAPFRIMLVIPNVTFHAFFIS